MEKEARMANPYMESLQADEEESGLEPNNAGGPEDCLELGHYASAVTGISGMTGTAATRYLQSVNTRCYKHFEIFLKA